MKKKRDVVCFGEILWDIYEASRRGDDAIATTFRRELGGAPANVAIGLARLGVTSAVCGGIGRDKFGDALVNFLENDGVGTDALIRLPNRTGLTFVTRDAGGEPSFLFYRHETADVSIEAAQITPSMAHTRWALAGTSTLMTPNLRAATYRFFELAKKAEANLVVDLNIRAHMWKSEREMKEQMKEIVAHAALVKASLADLVALTGRGETQGVSWLAKHAPDATWVITRGQGPATAIGAHGVVTVNALRAKCIDATGAGDAFLAGTLATLLAQRAAPSTSSWSDRDVWTRALEIGHMLGAKAVSRAGAVSGLIGLGPVRTKLHSPLRSTRK